MENWLTPKHIMDNPLSGVYMQWSPIAKLLIIGGIALITLGLLWQFGSRFLPFLGRLPGDIVIERENFRLYIPITTMILVSVVLSLLFALIARFLNK
jgi:hypothetical protein